MKFQAETFSEQKMEFSENDFFGKFEKICRKPWIWSDLLNKYWKSYLFYGVFGLIRSV